MIFNENDLKLAQKEGVISQENLEKLLTFLLNLKNPDSASRELSLREQSNEKRKFTLENFLYYFGALIIISAMGWYLGDTYDTYGNCGLLILSGLYFMIFTLVGNLLWNKGKTTLGGLLYVCAVSVVPLIVWTFEKLIGLMPEIYDEYSDFHIWIRSGFILMELATILAGVLFLKYRKFPFLTLPVCWALWYLSMDIVPLCMGSVVEPTWGMRNFTSLIFAILMLGVALKFDKKFKEDFSGWLYIFGATMFWCAIPSIICQFELYSEPVYFCCALICLLYMVTSVLLQRKVFMIWGAIGIISYIGHLNYELFGSSPLFVLSLVLLGLIIIFGATYYAKNCARIEAKLRALIFGN